VYLKVFQTLRRKLPRTRKGIGIDVFVIFGIFFVGIAVVPASWFAPPPLLRYNAFGGPLQISYGNGIPPVIYKFALDFSASGSFSVNNPVHVHSLVQTNLTNFLYYYDKMSFVHGFPPGPPQLNPDGTRNNAAVHLVSTGTGKYEGDTDIVWLQEGPSYQVLLPTNATVALSLATIASQEDPIIFISGVADTLSVQANENTAKLTWLFGSVAIIFLEPVLEAILVPDTVQHQSTTQAASENRPVSPEQSVETGKEEKKGPSV
jgi:hypothetical protein